MSSIPIYSLRPADVYEALTTSPEGLPSGEVCARQELYGLNRLTEEPVAPAWRRLMRHAFHPLADVLWVAGFLAMLARDPLLGVVVWVLVLVNAAFSYWREHRTEQAMHALRQLLPAYARVSRDGAESSLPASQLVPGDVLILAEGDNIPADARIVEAYGLRTNDSVLTGEANPVRKSADASLREGLSELERPNLVFAGASVVSGTGRAVVYATGMLTQFGRIAHLTQAVREEASPLQLELLRLTRRLAVVAAGIGAIVFLVASFELGWERQQAFLLALGILVAAVPEGLPAMVTLTLAVAGQRLAQRNVLVKRLSIIETLGTVSTICTDKSGTLTQNQMTVQMIWAGGRNWQVTGGGYEPVGQILPAGNEPGSLPPSSNGKKALPAGEAAGPLQALLCAALLCNNSRLSPPGPQNPRWSALGDQTEAALRVAAIKGGLSADVLGRLLPRIHELPFEARRKRMSTIHRLSSALLEGGAGSPAWLGGLAAAIMPAPGVLPPVQPPGPAALRPATGPLLVAEAPPAANQAGREPAGQEFAFVKGAPREVLELSTHVLLPEGTRVLDGDLRQQIVAYNDACARRGLRVLALAGRRLPPRAGAYTPAGVERDLVFLGLMAMLDPARPEVAEAVRVCRQAGIRMVMITGDYGLTAESLARRIGMLFGSETVILTGAELDALNDTELQALLDQEVVFARMAPEHKLRLVAAFQARGEVVAVTGDGVNDTPALRKADVGVAMGMTGTDVAKEAADVILVNDNFATIVQAIEEGRAVYDNLRKFMSYIFASNVPEILPFMLTSLFQIPLALGIRQILAIDLLTDMLPGLALGAEKPEPDIMRRPPRRRRQPLLERGLLLRSMAWLGLIEAGLAFSGFFLVLSFGSPRAIWLSDLRAWLPALRALDTYPAYLLAITMYHAGVVMAQVGNAFAVRSEIHRGRSLGWLSNPYLFSSVGVEIGLIILLIYFHPLAAIFRHVPLPAVFWVWLGMYPLVLYCLDWIRKGIIRRRLEKL